MIGEMHAEGIKVRAHSQLCHVDRRHPQEKGAGGGEEDVLNVHRERRLWSPVWGPLRLHLSAAFRKGSWRPGSAFIQQVLIERFLCSGLHARCFDFTVLAYSGQSLGSRWNSDQVVQVKGFRII